MNIQCSFQSILSFFLEGGLSATMTQVMSRAARAARNPKEKSLFGQPSLSMQYPSTSPSQSPKRFLHSEMVHEEHESTWNAPSLDIGTQSMDWQQRQAHTRGLSWEASAVSHRNTNITDSTRMPRKKGKGTLGKDIDSDANQRGK
jgi:hypothetical protein